MNEAWQILLDFPDYAVSNLGGVRRDTNGKGTHAGKLLKLAKDKDGYMTVALYKNKRQYRKRVHRLVMLAFSGPCPKGYVVNHIKEIKDYNYRLNLEYVTHQGNQDHAVEKGLRVKGQKQHLSKLTEKNVFEVVRLAKAGMRQRNIAKKFSVCQSSIQELLSGVSWSWLTGIKRKKKRIY